MRYTCRHIAGRGARAHALARRWNPEGWRCLGALLALVCLRPKAGIFRFFAVGRLGWIRADGSWCATVVDERCQGGNDAGASTADEFPCPRDPDDQRQDQDVTDQVQWAGARMNEESDARTELHSEDHQQPGGQRKV